MITCEGRSFSPRSSMTRSPSIFFPRVCPRQSSSMSMRAVSTKANCNSVMRPMPKSIETAVRGRMKSFRVLHTTDMAA